MRSRSPSVRQSGGVSTRSLNRPHACPLYPRTERLIRYGSAGRDGTTLCEEVIGRDGGCLVPRQNRAPVDSRGCTQGLTGPRPIEKGGHVPPCRRNSNRTHPEVRDLAKGTIMELTRRNCL